MIFILDETMCIALQYPQMNAATPTECPRTGDDGPGPLFQIYRSSPWFDDGSTLQAVSPQFRMYQGILAARSIMFKDMFALAIPSDGGGGVDGCPVVHLSDKATEVGMTMMVHPNPT